jgi:N-acetylneuraminate synthase/N,N'-diacetyllegionaminate synthase
MTDVEFAGRRVGPGHPCFLIAEAGVNHNGDPALAEKLVDAAKEAGADAVKFQTWRTEKLVLPEAPLATYQERRIGPGKSQFQMLKELELRPEDFKRLKAQADRKGILFFSTPDEEESADFLDMLGVPIFKIGSGEATNLPYLRHVARKGKPVILSTGMCSLEEVKAAVSAIRDSGCDRLILLHCVSSYPAPPEDCNLRAMDTLAAAFGCPVGFSDHTMGFSVAVAAAALGACVIEKHLTLDKGMPGPDHSASLDPREFAEMAAAVRIVEAALGDGVKRLMASEIDAARTVRKVAVVVRAIGSGQPLVPADVVMLRAAGGILPSVLPSFFGRRAARDIPAGSILTDDLLQ